MNISNTAKTTLEAYFNTLDWAEASKERTADTELQEELFLNDTTKLVRISNLVEDEFVVTAWSCYTVK
jgi:hypothetical protein